MNLTEFVKQERGVASELARRLQVSDMVVSRWVRGERKVPARRCVEIEGITKGAVTCEEMRPDINWSILRKTPKHLKSL